MARGNLYNTPISALGDEDLGYLFLTLADQQLNQLNQQRLAEAQKGTDFRKLPAARGWLADLVQPVENVLRYAPELRQQLGYDPDPSSMFYRFSPRAAGQAGFKNATVGYLDGTQPGAEVLFTGSPLDPASVDYARVGQMARKLLDVDRDEAGGIVENPWTGAPMVRNTALETQLWQLQQDLRDEEYANRREEVGSNLPRNLGLTTLGNPQPVADRVSINQISGTQDLPATFIEGTLPPLMSRINSMVRPTVGGLTLNKAGDRYVLGLPNVDTLGWRGSNAQQGYLTPLAMNPTQVSPDNMVNPRLPFGSPSGRAEGELNRVYYVDPKTGQQAGFFGENLFVRNPKSGEIVPGPFTPTLLTEPNMRVGERFLGNQVGLAATGFGGMYNSTEKKLSLAYGQSPTSAPERALVSSWLGKGNETSIYADAIGGDTARFVRLQDEVSLADAQPGQYKTTDTGRIYFQPNLYSDDRPKYMAADEFAAAMRGRSFKVGDNWVYSPAGAILRRTIREYEPGEYPDEASGALILDAVVDGIKGDIGRDRNAANTGASQAYRIEYEPLRQDEAGFAIDPQSIEGKLQSAMGRQRKEDLIRYYGLEDATTKFEPKKSDVARYSRYGLARYLDQPGRMDEEAVGKLRARASELDGAIRAFDLQMTETGTATREQLKQRQSDLDELTTIRQYLDDSQPVQIGMPSSGRSGVLEAIRRLDNDPVGSPEASALRERLASEDVVRDVRRAQSNVEINPFYDLVDTVRNAESRLLANRLEVLPSGVTRYDLEQDPVYKDFRNQQWIDSPQERAQYLADLYTRELATSSKEEARTKLLWTQSALNNINAADLEDPSYTIRLMDDTGDTGTYFSPKIRLENDLPEGEAGLYFRPRRRGIAQRVNYPSLEAVEEYVTRPDPGRGMPIADSIATSADLYEQDAERAEDFVTRLRGGSRPAADVPLPDGFYRQAIAEMLRQDSYQRAPALGEMVVTKVSPEELKALSADPYSRPFESQAQPGRIPMPSIDRVNPAAAALLAERIAATPDTRTVLPASTTGIRAPQTAIGLNGEEYPIIVTRQRSTPTARLSNRRN